MYGRDWICPPLASRRASSYLKVDKVQLANTIRIANMHDPVYTHNHYVLNLFLYYNNIVHKTENRKYKKGIYSDFKLHVYCDL